MSSRLSFAVKLAFALGLLGVVSIVAARAQSPADLWITMQARSALRAAYGARVSAVGVDTRNGWVTLYGTVSRQKDKAKAAEDVRRIPGVVGVRNIVQVVPSYGRQRMQLSDDAVMADVRRALREDPSLDDSRIRVTSVSNGVVLLSGDAASLSDNVRALRSTADRPGVRQVYSEIEAMPDAGRVSPHGRAHTGSVTS